MTPNNTNSIRISEIFGPTIQGEGLLIGQPTIFVRMAGCDFRCNWCDTLHAVDSSFRDEWKLMSVTEIWQQVEFLSSNNPITISLSGGNPAIQNLEDFIKLGRSKGYRFAMETQGSIIKTWFDLLNVLVLSPKPPSSHMSNDWNIFDKCCKTKANSTIIKIPILDEADYSFAREVFAKYPLMPFYLQPVNSTPPYLTDLHAKNDESFIDIPAILVRMRWLIDRAMADQWFDVKILPQLHVLIWGNKGGV
ncbi:7-carboxy-7-deazaguanine synthase QueE [Bartonella sp. TP]|uniref:7-carboxy-7-deazaguanine synthase QueE n=1 Tax=Bartonella sp. TP TaxID=3057550 RepID=UPI0025AEE609|nr:7-carboxy-7-deazaguanine synthase QueE [Bartonella sp. TP]WJW79683.1 7-carboxy-7-deazaguanine synthase QueE [Bartonella sp. TP]